MNGKTFLGFAVIHKKAGLIYKLKGNAEDLFSAVWGVAGGGVIYAVFYPVEEILNWLIDVVFCAKDRVVFL